MLASACLPKKVIRIRCQSVLRDIPAKKQCLHTTSALRNEQADHYEVLGVSPRATPAEIKQQYTILAKAYHPDLHPKNKDAPKRFMKIVSAYKTLRDPKTRSEFDKTRAPKVNTTQPTGSYSSRSTPAGGRPASGLSKRRGEFRGPPPSFYQSGGYGQQGAKRSENASKASHAWERTSDNANQSTPGATYRPDRPTPGVGPGGFAHGLKNDVPHFDAPGHYQTHRMLERNRRSMRGGRPRSRGSEGVTIGYFGATMLLLAAVGIGTMISGLVFPSSRPSKDANKAD